MGSDNIEAGLGSDIKGWCHISKEGGGRISKSGYHTLNGRYQILKGGRVSEIRYFTLLFDHSILNT